MNGEFEFVHFLKSLNQTLIVRIIIVLLIAWLLNAIAARLLLWFAERASGRNRLIWLSSIPVIRLLIFIGTIVVIVPMLITPTLENMVAILGAMSLALGFAFKDYISSVIAGIIVIYEQPYRPGDWVEIAGVYGKIKSMGLRSIQIVTPDDTMVDIPHTKVWDTLILNSNDGDRTLFCVADFYLHPKHDSAFVQRTLYDVALTSAFLYLERPIVVAAIEKPWGTHYRLKAYPLDARDQFHFVTDLTARAKAALRRADIRFVTTVYSG